MRKSLYILSLLSLCGCMATGTAYNSASAPPMQKGEAQIIVYRPSSILWSGVMPRLSINGASPCRFGVNGYTAKNINAGTVNISLDAWEMPGTSRLSFNAKPGQKYYLKIAPQSNAAIVGPLAGMISEQHGPFAIEPVDGTYAKSALQSTKETCN